MSSTSPNRVVAGISGGVDSSVAALLAQRQGLEVVALTLEAYGADTEAAGTAAKGLGVEHHVVDVRELLEEEVIAPFLDEYARGWTPNPCVVCNAAVKFAALLQWADKLGCGRVVTGHYARVRETGDEATVSFERPHRAPAPGQAAVFYQCRRLIGGGTIRSVP